MTTVSDKYLSLVRQSNEDRERAAVLFAGHFPDFPIEPSRIDLSVISGRPWLTFPYDHNIIRMIEQCLSAAGWTKDYEKFENKVGAGEDPYQTWRKKSAPRHEYPFWPEVIVSFSDEVDGAVCKRKEIGQRTQELPIYEWVCSELGEAS